MAVLAGAVDKSDTLIGKNVYGSLKYGADWNGIIIRRKYKDLAEIIRRIDQLINLGMPATRVGGDKETNYIKFTNGARITLTAIQMLDQVNDWQGHQFTLIGVDEAPTFPFIAQLIDRLKGSMRSPAGVPCQMFLTGNPGGSGASIIKLMFIDVAPPNTVVRNAEDGTSKIFIRSTIFDNKILCQNDPKYVNRLMSISDPLLRAAWLEGRWDVFVGQAFDFTIRHQIDPIWPIPQYAPLYMTFDWGFGAPFSIGWWWVDSDGRGYRFAEWYGWNEGTPNVGLRLTDPEIAEGILVREQKLGILQRKILRVSGPDCFSRKPNYLGGGQGPSTAEEMAAYGKRDEVRQRYGDVDLTLIPGDADRKKKIRQFRNRLAVPKDANGKPTGEMPMLVVYNTCRHFIRTIPQLTLDDTNLEDLDDHQEDHCLTGDTEIVTRNGARKIADMIGTKGWLLTAGGSWTTYHSCRKTRSNAEIVQVEFADGSTIRCTPDHKFLTEKGFVEARSLEGTECFTERANNTILQEVLCKEYKSLARLCKSSTENITGFLENISETQKKSLNYCIGPYGNSTMETYQTATTFTTKTLTNPTTLLRISNSESVLSTDLCTLSNAIMPTGSQPCTKEQTHGTDPKKAKTFIENSTLNTASMLSRNPKSRELVSFVEMPLRTLRLLNSVRANANSALGQSRREKQEPLLSASSAILNLGETEELALNLVRLNSRGSRVKVTRVSPAAREDVYCLIADFTHTIVLQVAAITRQCYDESAHFCMCRPIGMDNDEEYKTQKRLQKTDAIKQLDSASRAAAQEFYTVQKRIAEAGEYDLPDDMLPELYGLPDDNFDPSDVFG